MNQDKRQRFAAGTGAAPEGSTGSNAGRAPREGAGPELCHCSPGTGPALEPLLPWPARPLTPRVSPAGWAHSKDELPDLRILHGTGWTQSLGSLGPSRGDPLPPEGHIPTGHTLLGAGLPGRGFPGLCQCSTDQNQIFHTPSTNSAFTPLTQYSCQTPTSI